MSKDPLEDYGESNPNGAGRRVRVDVEGFLTGGAQVITSTSVTDDNSVAAGATSVGFTTSSDFVGTINGATRAASTFYGFGAAVGRTLPAIPYVTTAGSIVIDKIV